MTKKMITSLAEASAVLACPHTISDRKAEDYARIAGLDPVFSKKVEHFFQQWPMYNDGQRHKLARSGILRAMSRHTYPNRSEVEAGLKKILSSDRIAEDEIKECVLLWHSRFFGIESSADLELMHRSEPLIDLVIFHQYEKLAEAKAGLDFIEAFFSSRQFQRNGLVDRLLKEGNEPGAVMNLLIDSYAPMIAGTRSVLFYIFSTPTIEDASPGGREDFILRVLGQLPPFRFINRLVPTQDGKVRWVGVDVQRCNTEILESEAKPKKPLGITFGSGRHMCIGFKAAMDFFDDVLVAAESIKVSGCFEVVGRADISLPVCTVLDFQANRSHEVRP